MPRASDRLRESLPASSRHLAGVLDEVQARLDALQRSVERTGKAVERTRSELAALERRLGHTQALVARTYENQQGWAERLRAIRSSADYERAFEGEPLVTVRIPTHDRVELLFDRALASVRRQSYESWEAIVVGDDCDEGVVRGIEDRLAAIDDPRIRFMNLPLSTPRPGDSEDRWRIIDVPGANAGVREARGQWIAPLDDDDSWDDDHLQALLDAARESHAELAYGRMRVVLDGSERRTSFGRWPPQLGEFGFQAALYHAGLREFSLDPNAYLADEVSDWNLARRMLDAGVRFTFLDRIVGSYHVAPSSRQREAWEERAASAPLDER